MHAGAGTMPMELEFFDLNSAFFGIVFMMVTWHHKNLHISSEEKLYKRRSPFVCDSNCAQNICHAFLFLICFFVIRVPAVNIVTVERKTLLVLPYIFLLTAELGS